MTKAASKKIKGSLAAKKPLTKNRKAETAKFKITIGSRCEITGCTYCGPEGPMVALGTFHGYTAKLTKKKDAKRAQLRVGCQEFLSAGAAEKHWRGGQNPHGTPRPRAAELIAKARDAAKAVGWQWGRRHGRRFQ